jgi:hypothetical protein
MTENRRRRPSTGTIALLLGAGAALSGCTLDQILIGQLYVVETPPTGRCPALIWQFVINPQHSITGSLLNVNQQPIAALSGQLNAGDSFQITASDIRGQQTASVTGQFRWQESTVVIHGDAAGSACDGQTLAFHLSDYFARQGGGESGGGGGNG